MFARAAESTEEKMYLNGKIINENTRIPITDIGTHCSEIKVHQKLFIRLTLREVLASIKSDCELSWLKGDAGRIEHVTGNINLSVTLL